MKKVHIDRNGYLPFYPLAFIAAITILATVVHSESPYIQRSDQGDRSPQDQYKEMLIRSRTDSRTPNLFPVVLDEEWVGKRFIFMPVEHTRRENAYQKFTVIVERRSFFGRTMEEREPRYEELVGKIATVTEVIPTSSIYEMTIKMRLTDSPVTLVTETRRFGKIDNVAYLDDLDRARATWIGKDLWVRKSRLHDNNDDFMGSIQVPKYCRVRVADIVLSSFDDKPARFLVVTESDTRGYLDCYLSTTNIEEKFGHSFNDIFFTSDPRIVYSWPEQVWRAIESEKVFVGMTKKQVEMSWGWPKKVNKTIRDGGRVSEQWVYVGGYLYFDGDILETIQN